MAISFAGVALPTFDPAIEARIEAAISPSEVYEQLPPRFMSKFRDHLPLPLYPDPGPIKLGTVQWPTGASLWGRAHFLIDDATANAITPQIYDGALRPLVLSDGQSSVTLNMEPLPLRPVFETTAAPLWILSLVDQRYAWWFIGLDVLIQEGVTQWTDLLKSIGKVVLTTFNLPDAIPSFYLMPPASLISHFEYLPPLIDAIAYSVGCRVVSNATGTLGGAATCTLVQARRAKSINDQQISRFTNLLRGGGVLRASVQDARNTINSMVPSSVTVTFPQETFGLPANDTFFFAISTQSLSLPELGFNKGGGVSALIHSSACYRAPTAGDQGGNVSEIKSLATQIAIDYILWRLPRVDARFQGIIPWQPDGFADVEWSHRAGGRVYTTVRRPPWNAEPLDLCHRGTPGNALAGNSTRMGGTGPALFGKPVAFDQPLFTLATRNVQIGSLQVNGTVNDLVIPDCTLLAVYATSNDGNGATINSIANPASCMELYIANVGSQQLTLKHLFKNGLFSQNLFRCPDSVDYVLKPNSGVTVVYDQSTGQWRVLGNVAGGTAPLYFACNIGGTALLSISAATGVALGIDQGNGTTPFASASMPTGFAQGAFTPGNNFYFYVVGDLPGGNGGNGVYLPLDGVYLIGCSSWQSQAYASVGQPNGINLELWVKGGGEPFATQASDNTIAVQALGNNPLTTFPAVDLNCSGIVPAFSGDVVYPLLRPSNTNVNNQDITYQLQYNGGVFWGFKIK